MTKRAIRIGYTPTTTGACTSTESSTPTSSRCHRSWSLDASRSGRPTYAVVPLRETTLIASGSRPNRRRMSATAMYGRDVRYRRRLEVLGRLLADMGWTPVYAGVGIGAANGSAAFAEQAGQ